MKRYNILVTGVGAIIGYGIIHCLRHSKYDVHIVGMDIYNDAYGKYICDEFIQAIPAADPQYPQFLRDVIREKKIDLVFFGVEQELYRLVQEKEAMGEDYQKLVINNPDILELSKDKWLTHAYLVKNGVPAIPSYIIGEFEELAEKLGVPFLLKPRWSYASKGIQRIHNEEEFAFYKKRAGSQFMVQRIIGDAEHEYTAATFAFGDGTCIKPIVLKRKLSQEGATAKAWATECPEIEAQIYLLVKLLKPIGPTNFQFRHESGQYYLLETNPRISSATSIREAFGYNEAEMCISYFLEKKKPGDAILRKGSAIRYIADYITIE